MSYWLEIEPLSGSTAVPADGEIIVIGSGFSGVSCAYFLQQAGYDDILLLDDDLLKAASFRNCGHILPGPVESIVALSQIHGQEKAKLIWKFSEDCCFQLRETVEELGLEIDYRQDGYLVIAIDAVEDRELQSSVELLTAMGFSGNRYVSAAELADMGVREAKGARYDAHGACAHPVKFRNELLKVCLARGLRYHSGQRVDGVKESSDKVHLSLANSESICGDAVVLATNAYTSLLSPSFSNLITPFRGQIIGSKPLQPILDVPFSFNHGYEYGLFTSDNRLMFGGWREHTPTGETGTFDLHINPAVEEGLRSFCARHLGANTEWEYSWSGIMGASTSGLPYVGTTPSPRIFVCAGFTGHGFGWAHGCAKLLQRIMVGEKNLPAITRHLHCY